MLPSPGTTYFNWNNHAIKTPTFRLTPVEKPDMSPFLFHMTGRSQLYSILSGDIQNTPSGHGFLRASVPESNSQTYDAKVVCVTETPIFALDFFRYRSYRRWSSDQRFGIGFDKEDLARIGARPCIYADEDMLQEIISIKSMIDSGKTNTNETQIINSLISKIYPLTMPLLEQHPSQGFMWEREWRYFDPTSDGLIFPYKAIRVICCPAEEEADIKAILGTASKRITFIRSWKEYNEVIAFLKKREGDAHIPSRDGYTDDREFLAITEEQLKNYSEILSNLLAYKEFTNSMDEKKKSLDDGILEIERNIETLKTRIEKSKNRL